MENKLDTSIDKPKRHSTQMTLNVSNKLDKR
jgi:hypothetical protein